MNYIKGALDWAKGHLSIVLWVFVVILLLWVKCNPSNSHSSAETISYNDSLQVLKQYRDRNNRMVAVVQNIAIDRDVLRKKNDSLAKALKIKPKFIKGVDQYQIVTDTLFKNLTVYVDTTSKGSPYYSVEKKDNYVDVQAVAGKDTGSIYMAMIDTLYRVETVEKRLFKRTKHNIYIRNTNPYTVINKGNSFSIKEKRVWLSIGPDIGWDITTHAPTIGITLQIPIIQFKH